MTSYEGSEVFHYDKWLDLTDLSCLDLVPGPSFMTIVSFRSEFFIRSMTTIPFLVFSCEEAALEGLTDVSGSQTIVYNVMHLYVPSL